uniref:Pyrin domain-containing protein n=1 Tax=Anguilla anguilla TaxID=7936 RepID=A0A0E9RFR8_ANGAN
MAGIRDLLRTTLDDILADDLQRFRLSLSNDLPEGVKPIGKGRLEKKGVIEIVERMVEVHGEEGAGRVTPHVLRKIDQHDLAQRLEKDLGKNNARQTDKVRNVRVFLQLHNNNRKMVLRWDTLMA